MWLIDTTDLTLKFFTTEYIGQFYHYAVLSHTWGDDEVLFADIREGRGPQKRGWFKVVKTCEQARKDGLKWAWVDSCCINKESSAELTEAINSMFVWYGKADRCYAYLGDVSGECPVLTDENNPIFKEDGIDGDNETQQRAWHEVFAASRWFTRGWTLQELIAPPRVQFFGKIWNSIGYKDNLARSLHRITKIDMIALESVSVITTFVAARKMAWAANRTTTRVEDRAYCLLGIFDVNMPLLYGEGSRAFVRLQEEIIRTSTDHSIFAWKGRPGDTGLFAESPDNFLDGHRMVRWQAPEQSLPFRLTNQGVSFDGMVVIEDSDTALLTSSEQSLRRRFLRHIGPSDC